MKRLVILLCALTMILATSVSVHATDIYISDQGGSHVGSCEDNTMASPSTLNFYNLNYGTSAVLWTGGTGFGGASRAIFRYDITSIDDSASISAAEIVVRATAIAGSGDTVSLYQIATANNDWVEGTKNGATESGSSCWNDYAYQNITEWAGSAGLSTATTDYINTKLASDQAISTTGEKTFTFNAAGITALEGQLVDNDFEVLFKNLTTTTGDYITFASSENGTTSYRPYLHVTYTIPAGVVSQVIMVVLD